MPDQRKRKRFKQWLKQRLKRATPWYTATKRLGWGSLCLVPHDLISVRWVEQTLRVTQAPR
ncbi:hypothetical protein K469DRAFT_608609 [Zopfia rhizophila CBS 207.26]|uniref:Uncharacterized protein n=1 Tax=Zopfia rhizophila CBS 207.26 TaxID=1314779 RepID=A0A6A6DAB0_9PEZI|nr:hypothetical protein K469DRAFT_608609 [Zopfia rhizophila CBS 207.26]